MSARLNLSVLRGGLKGAASSPVLHVPLAPPIGVIPPRLGVIQGPGTVTLTLNGVRRWIIDVRQFSGAPTLTVRAGTNGQTRISLEGARLPGTGLPADFVLLAGPLGPFGTPGDFTFTLGGFHGQVILERWLAGTQVLQSPVKFSGQICPLGAASDLAFSANGEGRFWPDWLMEIGGPGLATVSGLGSSIVSDSLDLKVLGPTDPTISIHPKPRRTLLALAAGGHQWNVTLAVTAIPIGTLAPTLGLFNRISVEAGEGAAGDMARELVATSARADALTLAVPGGPKHLDGNPFALPLASPTYAVAFDTSADHSLGDQTFLTARFGPQPAWLVVEGFALLLGDTPAGAGFEMETLNGAVTSFHCAPELIAAATPVDAKPGSTVSAEPMEILNSVLPFVTAPGPTPGWGIVAGPDVPGQRRFSLPDFKVSLLRREDLLALEFGFFNLALEAGGGTPPQLVRKDAKQPAYLVAQFDSPQNIAEQAYLETSPIQIPTGHQAPPGGTPEPPATEVPGSTADLPAIAQTRAAGPSRLAFRYPTGTNQLPYSLAGLLNWVGLEQSVTPVAAAPDPDQSGVAEPPPISLLPTIRPPGPTETAIEAPWRVFLSPNYSGAWAHATDPVTLGGLTELWHTRLAVRALKNHEPTADETIPRRVRAVWSPDYNPLFTPPHPPPFNTPAAPFRMSLDPDDRDQIVRLSSDFTMSQGALAPQPYPISIPTDKLFLTSLGAWIDVFGNWPEPLPHSGDAIFSVLQWQHRGTMARDNYVRVVYAGFLLPFGHAASLVKVTERKLQSINGGPTTAYLRQRFFVVVREPVRDFTSLNIADQRHLPYRSVRLTTLVTPDVVPALDATKHYAFFPTTGPNTFLFHAAGADWDGKTSEFTAPLYFVERGGDFPQAVKTYNGLPGVGTRNLAGQQIAFAASGALGDTTLHTSAMTFSAQLVAPVPPAVAATAIFPFFPRVEGADITVPSIQQLTGGAGAISVTYYDPYVTGGMGPGEVFLQKTGSPLSVGFNGKQSGGVATPNLTVSGLSRKFGTVSGATPDNVAAGNFQSDDIFKDIGAKLFGVIDLKDLVDAVAGAAKSAPILNTIRSATEIRTVMSLEPVVHKNYHDPSGFLNLDFNGDLTKAFLLQASIVTPLTGGSPQVTIHGELNNFTLSLAKVVGITINQIGFDAPAGQKITVSASMPPADDNGPIEFLGDLSFLNELRKYIPSDGFQDPPSLDVTSDGITAGYSLPLPSIGVGVFSLENIALSAQLTLPFFTPTPVRFRFAFSSREHPFLISVSLLGGGGFFGVTVGPDGVEILEASIEVGANVSISVVVASGNVHIMAGVYLRYDMVGNSSQLTGYLRAGGSLDVLGLISASVEFYLGFTYFFGPPCSIAGEATVTIEVHVLFFSASVSASLRREFSDPQISFADLIGPADWDAYCDSFAA